MPRGRGLGRLQQRSPQPGSNLRREQGETPLPFDREARAGGAAECYCEPIQEVTKHLHRQSACPMPNFPAARRREVAGRLERQLKEERRANWMASLRGPGSARGEHATY